MKKYPKSKRGAETDPDTLDIAQTAEDVQEENRTKRKRPKSRINSLKAHTAWLNRTSKEELFRQKLKDAWNKRKKL